MSDTEQPSKTTKQKLLSWLPYLVIPVAVYFANVELQSHWGQQAIDDTGIPTLTLEQALTQAKSENKRVLANMSAIWCPSCRKLDKEVLSNDAVKDAINERYVYARIEYESDAAKAFMERYKVNGFPTLLILDADGTRQRKLALTYSPEDFVKALGM